MAVEKGNTVKVEYEGKFEDGTVFDSSEKQKAPLEFEVGAGRVIKGFDDAVIGMEKGQEKEFKIEPKDAYGDHNPQLVKKLPRDKVPNGAELKEEMIVGLQAPNGQQIPGKIAALTDKEVSLDLNHPLAGKTLNFKIKVVEVA